MFIAMVQLPSIIKYMFDYREFNTGNIVNVKLIEENQNIGGVMCSEFNGIFGLLILHVTQ